MAFFTSARNKKLAENEPKFDSELKTYFWLFFIKNLYWKWLNYAAKSYHSNAKRPFVLISLHKWLWNWLELGAKLGNLIYILSVLSARFQLENWSAPARLDSARNLHSSGLLEPENYSSNSSDRQHFEIYSKILTC